MTFRALGLTLLLALLAAAPARATPPVGHVFVVVLENKGYGETFGAGSAAPYLSKTLASQGQLLSQYHATAHLSLPNYIAMVSGQGPNAETQTDCQRYTDFVGAPVLDADGQAVGQGCVYPAHVKTVADQLAAKGLRWRGYLEDMGTACRHPALNGADGTQAARRGDQYAARHNPFVYFHSIIDSPTCASDDVPLSRLPGDLAEPATTPNLSLIVPNLCDDGHDSPCVDGRAGGLPTADAWLRWWVPKILASPAFRRDGLLVVTFDEAESGGDGDASACCGERPGPNTVNPGGPVPGPGGGRIGAVVVSPFVTPGTVNATPYNHYALLRSIEDLFGLGHLGFAGQAGLRPFGSDVYGRATAPGGGAGGTGSGASAPSCADATFVRASARPRGRALALAAEARGPEPPVVSVLAAVRGRRVLRPRVVRRFAPGRAPALWRPRRLRDGVYVVRFTTARRGAESRRVAVVRSHGRFRAAPAFERHAACGPIGLLGARHPAFGGHPRRALRVSFRLAQAGTARLDLLRGGHRVRRLATRRAPAGRTLTAVVRARGLRRGTYRIRLTAHGRHWSVGARRL